MQLTLFHYWRSSASWRVRFALELKKLKAQMVHVDILNGENEREPHLTRNPFGYVPVLEVDGNRRMTESVAILEWLDETFSTPKFFPGDSYQRAHIRALVETINAGTQPLQNLGVPEFLTSDPSKHKEWNRHFIRRGLAAYDRLVAAKAGTYSVGDSMTAADILLVPQCYNALRFDVDLNEFPAVKRIHAAVMATPEYLASVPERYKP